ncbi:MAG: hypothetical protein FP816_14385 [Desulfobacteraceae bacterium]|nr:hypothetical protein [Desulfobacteraceae bacterium]MBU4053748.1 hypothetical protein [Pseudomonadota bacterium]
MKRFLLVSKLTLALLVLMNIQGAWAVDMGDISVHGFVSQGYLKTDQNNFVDRTEDGTFEFNEAAINFSLEPMDSLRIGLQLMSRDMGDSGNNDLYLDWGYADYRWKDSLGFRVGQIKVPMGFYNQNRDVDFLRTFVFLPQCIYNENYRAFRTAYRGVEVYGNIPMGSLGDMEYEVLLGTPEMDTDEPLFKGMFQLYALGIGTPTYKDADIYLDYGLASALRWNTSVDGLRFGFSNLHAKVEADSTITGSPYTSGANVSFVWEQEYDYFYVLSSEYLWKNFKFAAEYSRKKSKTNYSYVGLVNRKSNTVAESYYGSISYRFSDLLEIGTYYAENYPNVDDRDGSEQTSNNLMPQKDWTVSVRLDVLQNMSLKFETHFIDGVTDLLNVNHPDGFEDNFILYTAKCSVNF